MGQDMPTKIISVIKQGDQYYLPFFIKDHGVEVTPDNSDDIRIKVGKIVKTLSSGDLVFINGRFLFPITQEQSLSWKGDVRCQAQRKIGDDVRGTDVYSICVQPSIFTDLF